MGFLWESLGKNGIYKGIDVGIYVENGIYVEHDMAKSTSYMELIWESIWENYINY